MGFDYAKCWARRPRYEARAGHQAQLRIERSGRLPPIVPAELINFSRHGARLAVGSPLEDGEQFMLLLTHSKAGMALTLAGELRWQAPTDAGGWLMGCEFVTEVSMETLGEMFLNEILDDQPMQPPV
ncbi:MAG: PilZ domain-containing protein [Pirellulales bacterium]